MTDTKEFKDLIGTPIPLKSLAEYQAGSVVSRMVINRKSGTVTAFAFDKGEGLSEHSAPYDALVIVLEGEAEIPIGGVSHFVKEGDIVKEGQKVLLLEAMKMENNIETDKSGVVKQIKVNKGDAICEGDVLILIS